MKYKALLIGLGQIGMGYDYDENLESSDLMLSHAQTLSKHKSFDLIGGVDKCLESQKKFSKKFGKPAYNTYLEAIKQGNLDLVVVAIPTESHLEMIKEILSVSKPKLIILEKPLAYTSDEINSIMKIGRDKGVPLAVNYFRAYEPVHKNLSENLASGSLGFPLTAVIKYTNGIINNGSHWVQYISSFLGKLERIDLHAHTKISDNDFNAEIKISFKNGTAHFLPFEQTDFYLFELDIYGPLGKISIASSGKNIMEYLSEYDENFKDYKILPDNPILLHPDMDGYQKYIYDEASLFLEDKSSLSCSTESLQTTVDIFSNLEKQFK